MRYIPILSKWTPPPLISLEYLKYRYHSDKNEESDKH